MNSTDSSKIELGKKAVFIKSPDPKTSTILTSVPKGVKVTMIKSTQNANIITSRTQINIKVQNRRNTYQRINKKLGES